MKNFLKASPFTFGWRPMQRDAGKGSSVPAAQGREHRNEGAGKLAGLMWQVFESITLTREVI